MAAYNRPKNRYRRRKRARKAKKLTRRMVVWLFTMFALFVVLLIGLMLVIYKINSVDGDRYKKQFYSQQSYTNAVLNYQRGAIKDRNNTTMAVSIRKYDIVVETKTLYADDDVREDVEKAIHDIFGVDSSIIDKRVEDKPNSMYEHFDELRELEPAKVNEFKELQKENDKLNAVWFEEVYKRNYPLNTVGSNIVGFLSSSNKGTYGIEEYYNDTLSGVTGREYGYFDSDMNLQRTIKDAKDGNSVVLTIDANVQQIIENMIKDFQKKNVGAKNVGVMLMDPNNGDILAMASNRTFDLNDPQNLKYMMGQNKIDSLTDKKKNDQLLEMWSNFCISYAYEPGSTYKPFTYAACLDECLVNDNTTYVCGGNLKIADRDIHCSNRSGHGPLDLRHGLMQSCNVVLMNMGLKLGRSKFSKYNELYGFGQKTGVDLPGEASGQIHDKTSLNQVELATSSFGQTQTMTMVQMLSGFSSLVNGGNYYLPHVLKEIQNPEGETVEKFDPIIVKKTTNEATSKKLRSYLKSTVEGGTASPAGVPGYDIGGKTGTAEKRPVRLKNYLVSFIGCVPTSDPKAVIYVVIDEPHVADQAHSTYATEFASKIMKKVLPFLGLYPDKKEAEKSTPLNN